MRFAVGLIMLIFTVACMPPLEKEKKVKAPEHIITRDEARKGLPCFKCHSYQKFSERPKKGVFSHALHDDVGYHCNQCHSFQAHRFITIDRYICSRCHNLGSFTYKATVYPAEFNHKSHDTRFRCSECHPKIFLMKYGSSKMTKGDMYRGNYCGACHDGKKAFPLTACNKCHK